MPSTILKNGVMSECYLVADIGATNSRFAVGDRSGLQNVVTVSTAAFGSSAELIDAACAELGAGRVDVSCFAVAGPVEDGEGKITNGDLRFSAGEIGARLDCDAHVVNDFVALGQSLPALEALRQVGGEADPAGVKALLGPGSGLGMGVLVPQGDRWISVSSEGGHADLAPGSPLELELLGILQRQHDHVCWETVLSGPGLVNLHRAVGIVWGGEHEALDAEEITRRGTTVEDPVCHQTLEVFFGLLGSAAGNLALTVYATGGVYIGGGIVPRLVDFAEQSGMRRRFEERGAHSSVAKSIPMYVICDENPGLLGALRYLAHVR